jgi:hypothetical protein
MKRRGGRRWIRRQENNAGTKEEEVVETTCKIPSFKDSRAVFSHLSSIHDGELMKNLSQSIPVILVLNHTLASDTF